MARLLFYIHPIHLAHLCIHIGHLEKETIEMIRQLIDYTSWQ